MNKTKLDKKIDKTQQQYQDLVYKLKVLEIKLRDLFNKRYFNGQN